MRKRDLHLPYLTVIGKKQLLCGGIWKKENICIQFLYYTNIFYYIDTNEIAEFLLSLKLISLPLAVKIIVLSFTCEDTGVAKVTNIIGLLQLAITWYRIRHVVEFIFELNKLT